MKNTKGYPILFLNIHFGNRKKSTCGYDWESQKFFRYQ